MVGSIKDHFEVEVLGDEVAWIRVGSDRRLYASTPLNGFFLHISGFDPSTIEHPQASVAVRCINCPTMHAQWESSNGVPLSAIIFCTRRHTGVPLISEAFTWQHGFKVMCCSTAEVEPIFDPMGMARFLGYSFGDYLKHWLSFDKSNNRLPKLFFINLFQSGSNNEYLWPGYGDNIRIFEWIIRRISSPSVSSVIDTPVGFRPL
uniref:Phosphoenolpyruvate carboxykinase C-terminal P-loop domain-containing protein n=1 Tax=Parascaris equorum TaxID=6256 RepID=A0A914S538_PAREQ